MGVNARKIYQYHSEWILTITTTELYGKREDLNPRDKLKVLLISSNTNVSKEKDVLMGNEKLGGIELNSVPQLDQPNNEIDTVSDILRESKGKDGTPNVEIQKIPTSQIYYSKFLKILENEEFDVIHYNGHGYFNKEDPERSFIAFWEKEDSKGNVMALTTNDLYSALNRSKKLKLVYLSCCEGGEIGSSYQKTYNNFLGLIEPVINAGVPNVIAMRWPRPVHYAKNLASNFYTALFLKDDFGTIESAMSRARLLALKEPPAWCCPILVKQDF